METGRAAAPTPLCHALIGVEVAFPLDNGTRVEQHWIREEGAVVDAGVELAALVTRIGRGWQFVQ